jgi:DNA-binding NarL/FixJ family response regulator
MTWRGPNDLERFVLRQPLDARVLALARALVLAPRIEPLLLRNARLAFLPAAGAELEARLWLSPLVAARSSAEIVLHLGIAAVLAGGLQGVARAADARPADGDDLALPDDPATPPLHLDTLWAFTREQTRHWPAADRLERDLRYHALRGDDQALAQGLGSLLAEIAREGDEARRISLSRLAKRTLPGIRRRLGPAAEAQARQLARYAALALQDGGGWSDAAGEPAALPRWLAERLPPPLAQAELGVTVRGGADNPVLHLLDPTTADTPVITLPSPLPARLHVRAGGAEGAWHSITRGTCIPLDPPGTLVELTTLTGRRWLLQAELPRAEAADQLAAAAPPPLRLVHAAADEAAAKAIADWLRGQGIPIELLAETEPARIAPRADQARAVRLWTSAARALWADTEIDPTESDDTLLLRMDDAKLAGPMGDGVVVDWPDWQSLGDSPHAGKTLRMLEGWWRGSHSAPTDADISLRAAERNADTSTTSVNSYQDVPPSLRSVLRVVTAVNQSASLDKALGVIIHDGKRAIEADACSVYLTDTDTRRHLMTASDGLDPDAAEHVELPLNRGLVGLIAERAVPVNLDDASTHPRYLSVPGKKDEGFHGFLGVPLLWSRRVLGVLVLRQRQNRRFSDDQVAIGLVLASSLTRAIARARGIPGDESWATRPDHDPAIVAMLTKLEDPQTTPPWRLGIGDLLEAIGDPRPGVGIRDIDVPIEIRVFIVDDHRLVREGLRSILSTEPGIMIAGEAESGEAALASVPKTKLDVVTTDVNHGSIDGIETTRKLLELMPRLRIIGLSMQSDMNTIDNFFTVGGVGFVGKGSPAAELLAAIRNVYSGQRFLGSEIRSSVVRSVASSAERTSPDAKQISTREQTMLEMVFAGESDYKISAHLMLTLQDLRTRKQRLLAVLREMLRSVQEPTDDKEFVSSIRLALTFLASSEQAEPAQSSGLG